MTDDPIASDDRAIARLRELLRKATPGEWKVILSPHGPRYNCVQHGDDQNYTSLEMEPVDAAIVVSAHNALPALLDCVEAAKAMRNVGVNLAQTIVDPGCDGPDDPVGEFIEIFDGPLQRAFDAALARLNADGGAHRQPTKE